MSEMLNMIVGRLESTPTITPTFAGSAIVKNYIITEGDEKEDREAKVPVVAWDDVAEEMLRYRKDDKLYLLCVPSESMVQVSGSMIPILGFKILKIDHDRVILPQINQKIIEILNK